MFLAYASPRGHALIDRDLYLPQSWADDGDRRRAAGIPATVEFTTKPRQAQAMISRALEADVPVAWFTADEVYGQAKYLQAWLEEKDVSYVLAIRRSDTLTTPAGEQPKAKPGSITTRSGPGGRGMPTSPCPCSPWPGSRPAGPRRKKGDRHQRPRHDRLHVTGDSPAADQLDPAPCTRPRTHLVLVHLAAKTPAPSPAMPLPARRIPAHLN